MKKSVNMREHYYKTTYIKTMHLNSVDFGPEIENITFGKKVHVRSQFTYLRLSAITNYI